MSIYNILTDFLYNFLLRLMNMDLNLPSNCMFTVCNRKMKMYFAGVSSGSFEREVC